MAPVTNSVIPIAKEWGYQIKWDGVRTLIRVGGNGEVEVFSKRIEPKNDRFPEITELFKTISLGACVLDGEIIYFDGTRPNFSRVLTSVRKKQFDESIIFVAFDLLYDKGVDIRQYPLIERYQRLVNIMPKDNPRILVSDMFSDGMKLWEWAEENQWEGIISKRLDSPYVEGKNHSYWFKKRKEVRLTADVVGLQLDKGIVRSLVLMYEGRYIGKVTGLDNKSKSILKQFAVDNPGECPFTFNKKWDNVVWLSVPFPCQITALEFTDSGYLRQPKIIGFGKS